MRRMTSTAPTSGTRIWRQLIMLFAGVLMLGVFTPIAATAAPGQLLVRDKTVVEDAGTVSVRIVLAKRVNHKVWVSYRTKSGTAVAGSDFTAVSGKIKFPRGVKARHVTVPLLDDTAVEGNERFRVRIFDPVRASIRDRVGLVTIIEDDAAPPYVPPSLSVKDTTAQEGAALTFEVSLSKAAEGDVTFGFATSDGTAKSPGDYTAVTAGAGSIAEGATSTEVTVQTKEDSTPEATESMTLTLSAPNGATLGDADAKGTITDDDPAVSVSVGDAAAQEGNPVEFTVTLSKASGLEVRVEWETSNGTAVAPGDYAKDEGVVTIPAGDLSGTFKVKTVDDDTDEVNETFKVTLSAPHNATISDGTGVGTIRDNDGPVLSIGDTHATEGADLVFKVSLSKASVQDVKVDWKTEDGSAKAPSDYTADHGTVTIPAGHLVEQVTVKTANDAVDEPNESFTVRLSDPSNASIGDGAAEGLIVDNDPPAASIGDAHATEGSKVVFTVTLSSKSAVPVTVDWATAFDTATALDLTADHGTLTIPADTLTGKIEVQTTQDTVKDVGEKFFVNLSNPVNASVGDSQGVGLIVDDD